MTLYFRSSVVVNVMYFADPFAPLIIGSTGNNKALRSVLRPVLRSVIRPIFEDIS